MSDELKNNHPDNEDNKGQNKAKIDKSLVRLSGMYEEYFLDYASYVILERAVPHLLDGLKPVQRRILHSMKRLDDGRFNKVANIIGHTMQFHPHGDASIGDALVQMGQKDLTVETQGNWGNVLTGDSSAAPRYIEARLSKFALDVVFNPKTTDWKLSYDGRNKEPHALPMKFPLLLAQGVEGIAVGLASKILPHNFNELIDASIKYLQGKSFELYPDFPTAGYVDVTRYNDGLRGGAVRVRAKIEKQDKKTLVIREIPFGKTTQTTIDSIIKAIDKGKIKIRKIDDNTAENVEILLYLGQGVSADQTIDALYAFTDCEVSISPNACVIVEDKPLFIGIAEILKYSADHTLELLKKELTIHLSELEDAWHSASLEKIFILNEVYEAIKECKTEEAILKAIDDGLKPYIKDLRKPVVEEDLIRLSNIPIKRISKYSSFKADNYIKSLEEQMVEVKKNIENIVEYTIDYYKRIKSKHGKGKERRTELRNFENIEASKVVIANEKLYANMKEGFIGTSLKKDEFVGECSDIDDIIAIRKDGKYIITKVSEKTFIGKDLLHVAVFKKNDKRTIYNAVYRDGMNGAIMMKRCAIYGITRDKEYDITKGTKGSQILYLSANPNGEAEVLKVYLKPRPRLKKPIFEVSFSELAIKGRGSQGNILTKYAIHKIVLKEKGESTLGGRKIYFDPEVMRLNVDGYGNFLGEFFASDKILEITNSGYYRTPGHDLTTHFEEDAFIVKKFNPNIIYSAVYYEASQKYYYVKRFQFEQNDGLVNFIGDNDKNKLILITEEKWPQVEVTFGGKHKDRDPEVVDVEDFIAVKGHKAKGKRLTNLEVKKVTEIEPLKKEDPEIKDDTNNNSDDSDNKGGDNSQMSLNLS